MDHFLDVFAGPSVATFVVRSAPIVVLAYFGARFAANTLQLGTGLAGGIYDPTLTPTQRVGAVLDDVARVADVAALATPVIRVGGLAVSSFGRVLASGEPVLANIVVTEEGLATIEAHLRRPAFDWVEHNAMMLDRLKAALGSPITGGDANFYLHELFEAEGMAAGLDYDAAHAAALQRAGISNYAVYPLEVIEAFPEDFQSAWREFWGAASKVEK